MTGRSVLTTAYAVIPRDVMRDIVTSVLPFWRYTRTWILARPLSGFAETFSQYVVEVETGGGSTQPDTATGVESVLFMLDGEVELGLGGSKHSLGRGAYAYVSADEAWTLEARSKSTFIWIRKRYQAVVGLSKPESFVVPDESAIAAVPMPGTNGAWATTRFVDPSDVRHDMHVRLLMRHAPGNGYGPAGEYRHLHTWRCDSIQRNARDGTRHFRTARQGRLPSKSRLGRGPARRFSMASRLLPAGLLRRWPIRLSVPSVQGCQSPS